MNAQAPILPDLTIEVLVVGGAGSLSVLLFAMLLLKVAMWWRSGR